MIVFGTLLQALSPWFDREDTAQNPHSTRIRDGLLSFAQVPGVAGRLSAVLFDPGWYARTHNVPLETKIAAIRILDQYLDSGACEGRNPTFWFDEAFYRSNYPDVQQGLAAGAWLCGYQHYLTRGMAEHRSPGPAFNELGYLGTNGDVLEQIRDGSVPNGLIHYLLMGAAERRSINVADAQPTLELPAIEGAYSVEPTQCFAEEMYLAANPDIELDGRPGRGMRHWLADGIIEDLRGTRPRVPEYVENIYLRENPDIAGSVGARLQPHGYHHFLMYGASEGRSWAGQHRESNQQKHLDRALRTRSTETLAANPLISVIVPVYNPDTAALRDCIESVRSQTYANWELCLVDDASFKPETAEMLAAAGRLDKRIRVFSAAENAGISAASNLALANCRGEFIALLDHDDLLAPDALYRVAEAFLSGPDVDLVYTDEAKLDEDGQPIELNPKPGWSPELLLSTMYIGHLTAYRRTVVERVGGFRSLFDGTQDYDLALRAAEVVRRVVHVPLPLYFWRLSPASTAGSLDAKPGVLDKQRNALESALIRRGLRGSVQPGNGAGHWRVTLDLPDEPKLVSVVIAAGGRRTTIGGVTVDLVVNNIRALQALETYPNVEYVVTHDEDLSPETLAGLAAFPRLRLVRYTPDPFNLSEKFNLGVREAAGEYVLMLNDDMQAVSPGIITSLIGRMFPGVGLVSGQLLYANGTLQHAGMVWTAQGPTHVMIGEHALTRGPAGRLRLMHNCFGVTGACMFFRRDLYLDVGGFSPLLPTNYNDVEFCLKVRERGLRIVFDPDVCLYHFESLSKKGTNFWELQLLCLQHPQIDDPFLNPSFEPHSPFYELRDPTIDERPTYVAWLLQSIARRRAAATKSRSVRFSIIMSVYQNRRYQMEELEATIVRQTYPNWEWVIVDDGSTLPETLQWLAAMEGRPGVTVIRHPRNRGIMAGYGTAFRAATGDYIVPVDADDFLTLDCLEVLATAIEAESQPEIVYSDEDKAGATGGVHSPFLKPDWDPVLFMNICFVCHICAIKRSAAQRVGAYTDLAATWSHDWDTLLRLSRAGARIVHVPEVLYSWRIHPGSTASVDTGAKPGTVHSQRHVLQQHLRLTGKEAALELVHNELFPGVGIWRLKPRPERVPPSAILLMAAGADIGRLASMLFEIGRSKRPEDAVFIIGDRAQAQPALERLPAELRAALGPDYAESNHGDRSGAPLALFDALLQCEREGRAVVAVVDAGVAKLSRNWLLEGVGLFAAEPDIAAVGGQVASPDGGVIWRGGYRGFGSAAASPDYGSDPADAGYYGMSWCQRSCDAVPSAFFCARTDLLRDVIKAAGGGALHARELAGRLAAEVWRQGLRIVYTPFIEATLGRNVSVEPIIPAGAADAHAAAYYHPAFGRTLRTAYALAPVMARDPPVPEAEPGLVRLKRVFEDTTRAA